MATVSPAFNAVIAGIPRVAWAGIVTNDTINPFTIQGRSGLAASVQIDGTFGGATVTFAGSNDGVTYTTLKDVHGNNISMTSAGLAQFSTACPYVKPVVTSGSGNSINVMATFRGPV